MGAHPAANASRLRRGVATITGVALAGAFIAYGGTASATPNPTASQVRAKIVKLMSQLDAVSQQYDQSITDLKAATARLKMINGTLGEDKQNLDTTRAAVAQIASAAYEQGNLDSASAILTSDNPQTVLDQAALLSQLVHRQARAIGLLHQCRSGGHSVGAAANQGGRGDQPTQGQQAGAVQAAEEAHRQEPGRVEQAHRTAAVGRHAIRESGRVVRTSGSSGGGITYYGPATGVARSSVAFAMSQIGSPYVWGGTGPYNAGYDCSGLVMAAWAAAGVQIPRTTYDQWAALPHVSSSDMRPGDLMYFDAEGHVAMYVGNGMLVDAPQPGQNVEEIPITTPWYAQNFNGAARP